ncbi:MAG: hypothetical protein FWE61_00580, partial [Micrococcales bacterium]|nr:hypothetical protein [Micrococcales bacterium]
GTCDECETCDDCGTCDECETCDDCGTCDECETCDDCGTCTTCDDCTDPPSPPVVTTPPLGNGPVHVQPGPRVRHHPPALASTGAYTAPLAAAGWGALVIGIFLVLAARRRRRTGQVR